MPELEFRSDSSIKRIFKNSIFTVLRFTVYALSGFIFIPFLVKQYGSGSYGLIALAGFLTQYVGLISDCVGRSVARFLNIALNKNDWQQANEIFSTAMVANIGFILIQIPFFTLGVWKLDGIFSFSPEVAIDFRILVICNIAVFFISMMTGVLQTPVQASNRLDISAKIDLLRIILRVISLVGLILWLGPKLWIIGFVDVMLALLHASVIYKVYRSLAINLIFKKSYVTKKWIKPVLNMAGWSLVSAFGFALFVQTDVWLINRWVDKEMAGIYAALLVWPNFIKQFGKILEALLGPVLMIDFAAGRMDRIGDSVLFGSSVLNYIGAVSVGFLWALGAYILPLWMGEGAEQYVTLLAVMSIVLVITLGEAVLWQVFPALNKVRFVGITNLITGGVNIALSIIFISLGWGAIGVAISTAIALVLKCSIVIPWKVSQELKIKKRLFVKNYVTAIGLFLFVWRAITWIIQLGSSSILIGVLTAIPLIILPMLVLIKLHFIEISRLYRSLVK